MLSNNKLSNIISWNTLLKDLCPDTQNSISLKSQSQELFINICLLIYMETLFIKDKTLVEKKNVTNFFGKMDGLWSESGLVEVHVACMLDMTWVS